MSLSTLVRRVRSLRQLARSCKQPEVSELYWARCELAMRQVMRVSRRSARLAA